MQVRIQGDTVTIEGYVNAVERRSKPLMSRMGQFIERICKGAFTKTLGRSDDVRLLLNHDWERDLGGTKDGNLQLTEDNIGLHARATITDKEVAQKARSGDLVGWSFGFTDRDVDNHEENGMPTRDVKDLDLYEVSILDRSKTPAYDGTLVSVRSDDCVHYHGDIMEQQIEIREIPVQQPEPEPQQEQAVDYSQYEQLIQEMKEDNYEQRIDGKA